MHTDPVIVPLISGLITPVITQFANGRIHRAYRNNHSILYTWRISGEAAPTTAADMIPMGPGPLYLAFPFSVDIYMVSENVNSSIRVELYDEADYYTNIARGYYPGKYPYSSYGERTTTVDGESGIIWPNGAYSVPPTSGVEIELLSDSPNDTDGGTGIQSLEVHYLDVNLDEVDETIILDGTNPVYLSKPVRFIQCMHLNTVGPLLAAAGNISARLKGGSTIYSYILAGEDRCSSSVRMVPRGKRLMLLGAVAGTASGPGQSQNKLRIVTNVVESHVYEDPFIFFPVAALAYQDQSFGYTFPIPFKLEAGNLVGISYNASKANTIVTGSWFGFIETV